MDKYLSLSRGLYQSVIIMVGSFIASGLSALSIILITRQLGPEKFGEFSVGFAILLILVKFNDLGMANVVQKYAGREIDQNQINRIFSFSTKVRLISMLIIWMAGLLLSPLIAGWLNFSEPRIIYLAFFLSIGISIFDHVLVMLQSLHRFTQSAVVNIAQAMLKFIGALVMFLTASKLSVPIFTWYVMAPGVAILALPLMFPEWVKLNLKQNFRKEIGMVRGMAGHSAVAFIAAGIIENIDVLFVQRYLNTYEAGLLGGVGRVALLFSILAYALSSVLNPRVAKYTDPKNLSAYLKKALLLAGASIGAILVYLPFSKMILLATIGEQYLPGLEVMNILVASSMLTLAVVPFVAVFFSYDAPWYFSVSGILQLLIIVVGNYLFVPVFGLEGSAWTRLVSRIVLFAFTIILVWYYFRKKSRN